MILPALTERGCVRLAATNFVDSRRLTICLHHARLFCEAVSRSPGARSLIRVSLLIAVAVGGTVPRFDVGGRFSPRYRFTVSPFSGSDRVALRLGCSGQDGRL